MLQKIVVALDLLDTNEAVFAQGLDLALATGGQLMLVHALAGDRDGGPVMPISGAWDYYSAIGDGAWVRYQSEWKAYIQQGLAMLKAFCDRAITANVSAEFSQLDEQPGRAICDLANRWEADVVVVGSHKRTGLSELFVGSVSNYVVHHAPCSVFVVSPNAAASEHIAQTKMLQTKILQTSE